MSELKAAACALWELKGEDVELLDWYNNSVHCSLEGRDKADKALKDVSILDNQYILLGMEVRLIAAHASSPLPSCCGPRQLSCSPGPDALSACSLQGLL